LNAGEDGSVVLRKLIQNDDYNRDYNAATGVYQGPIDLVKVVRIALTPPPSRAC
jgi:chaperonin GroEL